MSPTQKVRALHRDGATRPGDTTRGSISAIEDSASGEPHHEDDTGQVLMSAVRDVEPGSKAEAALVAAINVLAHKSAGDGGAGGGGMSRRFVSGLALLGVSIMSIVQPVADQFAERTFSQTSALEHKLGELIVLQAETQQQQHNQQLALPLWLREMTL